MAAVVESAIRIEAASGRPGGSPTPARSGETLGEFVTEQARRFGDAPALAIKPSFRTRITTYQELDRLARRVATELQRRGVQPGDRVLLWAPNMPEWVAAFFGCHQAGAVVVPLDVRSGPDFVTSVVAQTQPKLAFLTRGTARYAEAVDIPIVLLEELEESVPEATVLLRSVDVCPDDVAEIIFTSGTTGIPKGAVLTHRNILANVRGVNQVLEILPSFRLLSLLPLSHMLEQTVGLLAPLSGGCQVVYPTSRQPGLLTRAIAEHEITMLVLVPQALQLFLNAIEREARRQGREAMLQRLFTLAEPLPQPLRRALFHTVHERFGGKLDMLVCGGAYLDPALAHRWELMGVTVLQGYGATEASPIITCDRPDDRKPGAVGKAFPDVEIRIAPDEEVLARGENIFQGYWGNPEASAAALQDGWYHTGDLGSLDDEGFLHLKGRKNDLIVLANGQNVYPEDLETQLKHHPGVADAVVVGLPGEQGAIRVHAVLLMREAGRAAEAVRQANARLATHQQIRGYTVWPDEDFPRTHTLKVKKQEVIQRLRPTDDTLPATLPSAPVAPAEHPLRRIIAEISSMPSDRIGPNSTLGGDLDLDSLGRVELLSAIEEQLGAYIDEGGISPDTTVAQLERLVAEAGPRRGDSEIVTWPLSRAGSVARELFQQGVVFPLYHLFFDSQVIGQERLRDVRGPVLVACNHHFLMRPHIGGEAPAVWMALPRPLRRRLTIAGDVQRVFEVNPLQGLICRLCNVFPISREGSIRRSLEYMGRLLDLGWSVLIFPEGNGFDGGPLRPLKGGAGLMAVEARVPVVPMWVEVKQKSIVQRLHGPWRGAYTVRVGHPLVFEPGVTPAEATARIQAAMQALGEEAVP